ncbi:MAG: winged helix-turn-helix domain-containing protein [Promethearchaeota archaeon]
MDVSINYPPKELLKPTFGRRNFELIILWMLNNNDFCTWASLQSKISKSTLQVYLKKLMKKGFITKTAYNEYRITPEGRDKYYELSEFKREKRRLNYPPKVILRKRNYDHWILWMAFNNNYCKWADFLQEPLSINQSSLSINMNSLINNGFIIKEEKKYTITQSGKAEYSSMLKYYDLDRQTILEEESKRIKEITKKTISFFDYYQLEDKDIKYRYLNNVLKLPYKEVESTLESEEEFNKVLLFLSINHPDEFPHYISPREFSQKYGIKQVKLEFLILRIVEENIYPIKFFKLKIGKDKYYYFHVNERLERMLNAIVEDHITKFTYLCNLYEEAPKEAISLSLELIINEILADICGPLFNIGLKKSLKTFLPEYIDYLAYKIEEEKKLIDVYDKLEVLIWENMLDVLQSKTSGISDNQFKEELTEINKAIKLNPRNIDLHNSKVRILMYYDQYPEVLKVLDDLLEIFPENEKDIKMKKASVLKKMRNIKEGLIIINELIKKYPEDNDLLSYKAYWLQYLNKKEEAFDIMEKLIKIKPERGIYHDTYGEILMNFGYYDNAIEEFSRAIEIESEASFIYQTYIKSGICYKELENYDLAVENLNKGKELLNQISNDIDTKQTWLSIANLFLSEIEYEK